MIIAAFLQVANFHVAMIFGREFAGAAFVYWSLSLEEQFYLLLPFLVLFSGRRLPYVLALADNGASGAIDRHPELIAGVNIVGSHVTNQAVADSLGKPFVAPRAALSA